MTTSNDELKRLLKEQEELYTRIEKLKDKEKVNEESEYKKNSETLANLVKDIEVAIKKAEDFAGKNNLEFSLNIAYGMGGTFNGKWNDSNDEQQFGWEASSESCY